jgi:hypothetical protein
MVRGLPNMYIYDLYETDHMFVSKKIFENNNHTQTLLIFVSQKQNRRTQLLEYEAKDD